MFYAEARGTNGGEDGVGGCGGWSFLSRVRWVAEGGGLCHDYGAVVVESGG